MPYPALTKRLYEEQKKFCGILDQSKEKLKHQLTLLSTQINLNTNKKPLALLRGVLI